MSRQRRLDPTPDAAQLGLFSDPTPIIRRLDDRPTVGPEPRPDQDVDAWAVDWYTWFYETNARHLAACYATQAARGDRHRGQPTSTPPITAPDPTPADDRRRTFATQPDNTVPWWRG